MYKIKENVYDLDEKEWFEVGKRINKKRSFLFISKVLGKHIENNSSKILYASMLLSKRLNEVFVESEDNFNWELNKEDFVSNYLNDHYRNEKKMVFIGFAETATGIGHSVFDRFDNSMYFHTTREDIDNRKSILNFEEEHSHATSHKCYVDEEYLDNDLPVVLVDDEVSTGNTSLNIIKDIHLKYPRKEYIVVSILNWMNELEHEGYREFEEENDVKIHLVYLFKGDIDREFKEELGNSNTLKLDNNLKEKAVLKEFSMFTEINNKYVKETGRFGLTSEEQRAWKNKMRNSIKKDNKRTLVIGNGELMYIPIVYSYLLGDKNIKTTTRSPIFASEKDNIIKSALKFESVDGKEIDNYIYNLDINEYDKYLLLFEKNINNEKLEKLIGKMREVIGEKEIKVVLM